MTDKVLFVDDDVNILAAFQRGLHKQFEIDTANGAEEGLLTLRNRGPHAVVVSDLRMPGTDGIQFLTQVHAENPDTVRIMLSGNADVEAAIAAVNKGNIFRFLTKPVRQDVLVQTLESAIQQYHLVIAERELLQKTLNGSIKLLIDVLTLASPVAFSRSSRIARHVRRIAASMEIKDVWQFELAALLSQIGCIALPDDLLEKVNNEEELTSEERRQFNSHPAIGRRLLASIPRLESIAEMVGFQLNPDQQMDLTDISTREQIVALGASMLRAALDYDTLVIQGVSRVEIGSKLRNASHPHDPRFITALERPDPSMLRATPELVRISDLETHMVLDEDVQTTQGILLVPKGHEITLTVLEHLRAWAARGEVADPVRVLVPR
jgi:FixJ family two-component response regulator